MRTRVSKSRRLALVSAIACCLALLLISIWHFGGVQQSRGSSSANQEPVLSGEAAGSAAPLPAERAQAKGRSMEGEKHLYQGAVIWAQDGKEGERCLLSGNASVALFASGSLAAPGWMPVTRGAWSILAFPGSSLEVHRFELAGETFWPASSSIPLVEGQEVAIHIVSEPLTWFRDAESGEEITRVSVLAAMHGGIRHKGFLSHLGDFDPVDVPESVEAPLAAERISQDGVTYFTSQGYCWAAVPDAGKTSSVVRLERAGAVGIQVVEQYPHLVGCAVELFDDRGSRGPAYSILFEDLRPKYVLSKVRQGVYRFEIVESAGTVSRESLFVQTISVEKDTVANVNIILSERKKVEPTPVCFMVSGDERVVSTIRRLEIRPKRIRGSESEARIFLADSEVQVRKPGLLEYEPKLLFPGDYAVEVEPMGWYEEIVVPEDVVYLQEISLGMLQEYQLRLRDESGLPLEAHWAQVRSGRAESLVDLPIGGSSVEFRSSPMTFEAIEGSLMVSLSVHGFGLKRLHLDGRGKHDFDVVLSRSAQVLVELHSRSSPFLAPESWWSGVRVLSGSGEPIPAHIEFQGTRVPGWHSSVVVHMESPGAVLLEMPPLPGCHEPVLRLPLEAAAGASRKVLDVDSRTWVAEPPS